MKKQLLLVLSLFFISLIAPQSSAWLGEFPLGSCVEIRTLSNYSAINISTLTINQGEFMVLNAPMQNLVGQTFNYTYCNTSIPGEYVYDWHPCPNLECVNSFTIGESLDISQALIYIFILILIVGTLIFSVYAANKAVRGEVQIFYICLFYICLFSFFFVSWLISQNYLYNIPLLERIFWLAWLIIAILFPFFIIGISSYILKKQAEKLMIEDLKKEGYSQEEAKEEARRKRK